MNSLPDRKRCNVFHIMFTDVHMRFQNFDAKYGHKMIALAGNSAADVAAKDDVTAREAVHWHCIVLHIAYPHCCVGNFVLWL